ncbi:MAG: DNA-binding protein WhiA, partial [Alicyclobacillus sp.]|nr:DNA-binding protein WhiA [Alicyclobacillus sp.]
MSFAAQTKKELTLIADSPCCQRAELQAMVLLNGHVLWQEGRPVLDVQTENVATARRIYTLLRQQFHLHPEVLVRKKMRLKKNNVYAVRVSVRAEEVWQGLQLVPQADGEWQWAGQPLRKRCCQRAALRGAFLAAGSVNDPGSSSYHLEISCGNAAMAERLRKQMDAYGLHAKVIGRKRGYVV